MNDSVVYLQPAFILQHRKYRESSLILDILTEDFGVVTVLARGVRKKKSKTAGLLLPFSALKISYIGKNELKILTDVELDSSSVKLAGTSLYCGFYVNEMVGLFLHKNDPSPGVFIAYKHCLNQLTAAVNIEQCLRFFELNFIEQIGYGFLLTLDVNRDTVVEPLKKYHFNKQSGMVESPSGYISGSTLIALDARNGLDKQALYESKQLMRRVIDFLLQGKQLKSRLVLAKMIRKT